MKIINKRQQYNVNFSKISEIGLSDIILDTITAKQKSTHTKGINILNYQYENTLLAINLINTDNNAILKHLQNIYIKHEQYEKANEISELLKNNV